MTATATVQNPYRRNVALLAIAQGLFMCTQSMGIATTPLAGHSLLGVDKSLATLPIFLNHAGIMLTTIPASLLMGKIGRRAGFTIGAFLAIVFGLLAAYAMVIQSFELLCVSALLQGSAAAFAWYYRFAAADSSPQDYKAKAISYVMAGGIAAGFLGPEIAKRTVEWFAPVTFMGVYVAITITGVLSVLLMQLLRIPDLSKTESAEGGRPMSEIVRQPAYIGALISSMFGYGVMTLVMSATPLAMLACGFQFGDSATVIQVHIIAMFLPSFFTGHLIQKFGVLTIIATGALIQVGCAIVNIAGVDFANFLIANMLVGLGWNFTYVGGSTLLTRTYRPSERSRVQASHDFVVYATTATAAALAGFLQQKSGWMAINIAALPLMGIVMATMLWLGLKERREAKAQAAE